MKGCVCFSRTFGMENFVSEDVDENSLRRLIADTVARRGYVSLFTHEIDLTRAEVLAKTQQSICWASAIAKPAGAIPLMSLPVASTIPVQSRRAGHVGIGGWCMSSAPDHKLAE